MECGCEARQSASHKRVNNAMTGEQNIVMEGNDKTDELGKEGADADSGKWWQPTMQMEGQGQKCRNGRRT